MKPKLDGFEQWRNMWIAIAPYLLIIGACGLLFNFILESFLPPGEKAEIPKITFHNARPCLGLDQKLVERFEMGAPQYICADMETEESPVFLEVYIFKIENNDQVYVDGATFTSGAIAYHIYPPLPPGKYWARINWARTTLVKFEFEVVKK